MDTLKKLAKSKWTYVIALALAALISGGTYSDQIAQAILVVLGQ